MGKGDKKSRRGKIIIGSYGVRRPKSSKSNKNVKIEVTPVESVVSVEKVKKVVPKPVAEPKSKVKVTEPAVAIDAAVETEPVKTVKKAVKKTKSEAAPE